MTKRSDLEIRLWSLDVESYARTANFLTKSPSAKVEEYLRARLKHIRDSWPNQSAAFDAIDRGLNI